MSNNNIFKVGDTVVWYSKAGGHYTRKQGKVVAVIHKGTWPGSYSVSKYNAKSFLGGGGPRDHVSYLVLVPRTSERTGRPIKSGLYWPKVADLELVQSAPDKGIPANPLGGF